MSISEYFIPFTRIGINLLGERLFTGRQGALGGLKAWARGKQRYRWECQGQTVQRSDSAGPASIHFP